MSRSSPSPRASSCGRCAGSDETAAAARDWPARMLGGGVKAAPGGAPASMDEKKDCHETWTDAGS
eukprot:477986-Pleurochrysis_carterae.AAC.1